MVSQFLKLEQRKKLPNTPQKVEVTEGVNSVDISTE